MSIRAFEYLQSVTHLLNLHFKDNEEETGEEILSTLVGGQRKRPRTPTSGGETSDGELLATYSRPLTSNKY